MVTLRHYPSALIDQRGPTERDYGVRLESKLREVWGRSGRPAFTLEVPASTWMHRTKRRFKSLP